jgi:cell division protein FtsZ
MGHAVMGTAVRSGENRAIEAAQAAMASPLLEAGAIDGARGILINITGSSSLKLSEVNAASSLIQSAAHEDANIIFGAVLDEKMGEDVKITVIATGFRDQLPERRARMLSMEEEAPVVSVPADSEPVVSVPLVAPDNWLHEPKPSPSRFLSEDEDAEESGTSQQEPAAPDMWHEPDTVPRPAYFAAPPPPAPAVEVAAPPANAPEPPAMELVAAPARPKFAELSEEPVFKPLSRDYASEFSGGMRSPVAQNEYRILPEPALSSEANEDEQRDLDKPAFLRRLKF